MIDNLLFAKLPPHLKRSLNLAYLENGTYGQTVAHLERQLELSGLDNDGQLTIPTMTVAPPNDNQRITEQTKNVCHWCKNQATLLEIVVKGWKSNRSKEMILRSKTQNLRHLNILHPIFIANEQIFLQKMFEWSQCRLQTQTVQPGSPSRQSKWWARTRKLDPSRTFINPQKPFKLKKPRHQWADYTTRRQYII